MESTIEAYGKEKPSVIPFLPDKSYGVPNPIYLPCSFAVSPAAADSPTCLPLGPIGFSRNGVALYNPLNVDGENAVEGSTAEVFDTCNGHPDVRGTVCG